MSSMERQSEGYLRKVIEILHGVTLELFDRDGLQNVVAQPHQRQRPRPRRHSHGRRPMTDPAGQVSLAEI